MSRVSTPLKLRALDWAFEQQGLRPPARHLLLQMAKVGNSSLHSFMTMETMVQTTGLDERTIRKALKELQAANLIVRVVDKVKYGKRIPQYRLLVTGAIFDANDPPILLERPRKSAAQNPLTESELESGGGQEGHSRLGVSAPAVVRSVAACLPAAVSRLVAVDLRHASHSL